MDAETAQKVQAVVEDHDAKLTELFNQVQALSFKLATVENDRSTLITALAAATAPSSSSSTTHKPKAVLPDPEKFAGTPYTWETWHPSIQAKIRIDGAAIGGPEAQFFYIYGRLDATKIAILRRALNRSVRTKLDSQILVPHEYEGFVKMLLQLVGAHNGTPWSGSNGGHKDGGHKDGGEPMDLSTIASIGALDLVDEGHWRGEHKDLPTMAEVREFFVKK